MKEKIDKQAVEEMAKILLTDCEGACTECEYYDVYDGSVCIPMRLANVLYNKGYRKQSEGEWRPSDYLYDDDGKWYLHSCSLCGWTTESYCRDVRDVLRKYKFCPQCGAKMKGGAE